MKRKTRLPYNWRSRTELTRHVDEGLVIFRLSFKNGQTPKGFPKHIGELSVSNKPPHFIDEALIDAYFVKRGLGTLLYLHALDELGSLTTHYHAASDAAQGLWRCLARELPNHRIDFFAGTLTVTKP